MSVQTNQYLMYGVMLTWDEWKAIEKKSGKESDFDSPFEEYQEDSSYDSKIGGKDGMFCLVDGMNGKYVVVGRVLHKESDGEYLGSPPIEIRPNDYRMQEEVKKKLADIFDIQGLPGYYLITHYS